MYWQRSRPKLQLFSSKDNSIMQYSSVLLRKFVVKLFFSCFKIANGNNNNTRQWEAKDA
jgi:hypothetical protein